MPITVTEALELIAAKAKTLPPQRARLDRCIGLVLAESIVANMDHPPFDQSAVDGYALAGEKEAFETKEHFELASEIKAGDTERHTITPGKAVRIFTGAPIPQGTQAVVMQEHTAVNEGKVQLTKPIKKSANIRPQGEQIRSGDPALSRGVRLNPAGVGFLSGLGLETVSVTPKPVVSIAVTGDELVQPGSELKYGQIYESNSFTLEAALSSTGFSTEPKTQLRDTLQETRDALRGIVEQSDVTLISGGISVGDYDYVSEALTEIGVECIFHGVWQKPGKPMYFGIKDHRLVFALPGNPAAGLTCFYTYVLPALRMMSGLPFRGLTTASSTALNSYKKKDDKTHFLKAKYAEGGVEMLEGQSSAMLHTFAEANALVRLPGTAREVKPGDQLEVHLLPDWELS